MILSKLVKDRRTPQIIPPVQTRPVAAPYFAGAQVNVSAVGTFQAVDCCMPCCTNNAASLGMSVLQCFQLCEMGMGPTPCNTPSTSSCG